MAAFTEHLKHGNLLMSEPCSGNNKEFAPMPSNCFNSKTDNTTSNMKFSKET